MIEKINPKIAVEGIPYEDIVAKAREYIDSICDFEKFAEWGLF